MSENNSNDNDLTTEDRLDNLDALLGHLIMVQAMTIGQGKPGKVRLHVGDNEVASFDLEPFVQDLVALSMALHEKLDEAEDTDPDPTTVQ